MAFSHPSASVSSDLKALYKSVIIVIIIIISTERTYTSSPAVAERPRDASCPSVTSTLRSLLLLVKQASLYTAYN